MNTKDRLKISGEVRLRCLDKHGNVKWDTGFIKNTITKAGLAVLPNLVGGVAAADVFKYLAVGTGDAAEDADDTTLTAEITDTGLARAEAAMTRVTGDETNDTLQAYKEWTATGAKDIEEVGLFNDDTAGTMLGRKLTTTKTVADEDKLRATYKIKFG
jgi:hypothetical protein